jgi:hypothetical protein
LVDFGVVDVVVAFVVFDDDDEDDDDDDDDDAGASSVTDSSGAASAVSSRWRACTFCSFNCEEESGLRPRRRTSARSNVDGPFDEVDDLLLRPREVDRRELFFEPLLPINAPKLLLESGSSTLVDDLLVESDDALFDVGRLAEAEPLPLLTAPPRREREFERECADEDEDITKERMI